MSEWLGGRETNKMTRQTNFQKDLVGKIHNIKALLKTFSNVHQPPVQGPHSTREPSALLNNP